MKVRLISAIGTLLVVAMVAIIVNEITRIGDASLKTNSDSNSIVKGWKAEMPTSHIETVSESPESMIADLKFQLSGTQLSDALVELAKGYIEMGTESVKQFLLALRPPNRHISMCSLIYHIWIRGSSCLD